MFNNLALETISIKSGNHQHQKWKQAHQDYLGQCTFCRSKGLCGADRNGKWGYLPTVPIFEGVTKYASPGFYKNKPI